ncbi:MAG: magnesium transporter CorA family protein [Oscillospiraceae bacterium]|jgi:magnesium transporter|nr:magnesium transporter CorA family protein [Oscillospiraceae bacterium]
MITFYKTIDGNIIHINEYEPDCWVSCISPSNEEATLLTEKFEISTDFLRASLDEEESPHIDYDHKNTLIIIDIPIRNSKNEGIGYNTMPLGVILTNENVVTVCLKQNEILDEISRGVVRGVYTGLRSHFVLHIMLRVATKFLQNLKQIDKMSDQIEIELRRSMRNKELIQLLEVEKSLVFFSASLKANEGTLEKIMRGRIVKLYEEDKELLEDVLIEIKQAIEMSGIYLNILSGTMDAFASVISNNLNIVMKVLASITLLMSIPTVISGFYGMNMRPDLPFSNVMWFPFVLSAILMAIAGFILKKCNML